MAHFSLQITDWFRQNKRNLPWRMTSDPYFIWLSEIILQQTRVDQGVSYYLKFINTYPTVFDLAKSSEQEVLANWQGLGYYSRARNLHAAANYVANELNGVFPDHFAEIRKLKGIGDYTAAAIASFSFNEPVAVVDGNVYRVLSRYFGVDTPIDSSVGKKEFQLLAQEVLDKDNPAEYNQAIMEFGALQCTPAAPDCQKCPLILTCDSFRNDKISVRPVKSGKTKVRDRYFHVIYFDLPSAYILEKRLGKDIWQNMYQFPLIESENTEVPYGQFAGLEIGQVRERSQEVIHVLSHQRIHAFFYRIDQLPEVLPDSWLKIPRENLIEYPLPRLFERYLETK